MKILVTGCAGFIGAACCDLLLKNNCEVLGIDNLNDYYDVKLKAARLESLTHANFKFELIDIADAAALAHAVESFQPEIIIHLAAQAGVRYSLENPQAYIQTNLVGFANILELARKLNIKHLLYASSSSVYGVNEKMPFSIHDNVDQPASLYAATKKSNELMAFSYSHLYKIPCTGLRFFTVYGPWGRPDMAPFKFAQKIMQGETIEVYNHGEHSRDFTFIDDIIAGVWLAAQKPPAYDGISAAKIYNIGYGKPVNLLHFIELLEKHLGKIAHKKMLPKQLGDVDHTWADITELKRDFNYQPQVSFEEGIQRFAEWFKRYYF